MKVYRVKYQDSEGWVYEWFATKAEAKKFMKEVRDARGDDALPESEPELRVIPTDKKGLVRWLNIWHGGAKP